MSCGTNCAKCDTTGSCTECDTKYFVNKDGVCEGCSDKCYDCISA